MAKARARKRVTAVVAPEASEKQINALDKHEAKIERLVQSSMKTGLEIGRELIAIREDGSWLAKAESWNQYLKTHATELVGKSWEQATRLVRCAEIESRIDNSVLEDTILTHTHFRELSRLAPTVKKGSGAGVSKDFSKLKTADVKRVLKAAGPNPTVTKLRAAVDDETGTSEEKEAAKAKREKERARDAKAEERRKRQQAEIAKEDAKRELGNYLKGISVRLRQDVDALSKVPNEGWEELEAVKPGLCELVAQAADDLSNFMRSN